MKRWIHATTDFNDPAEVVYAYLELADGDKFYNSEKRVQDYKFRVTKNQFERNLNPFRLSQGCFYTDKQIARIEESSRLWEQYRQAYIDCIDNQ